MPPAEKDGIALYHLNRSHIKHPLPFGQSLLFQIGRLYCTAGGEIPLHTHLNWFELTIVTDGAGVVLTNGTAIPVSHGDIYLSFPGDFHGITSDTRDPLKYDFFAFNTQDPALSARLDALTRQVTPADCRVFRDERVRYLVEDAIAEIDRKDEDAEAILTAAIEQIIRYVLRNFQTIPAARHASGADKYTELCYRVMRYVDTHLYTITGLSDLSQALGYHYSYLSDVFRRTTGDTLLHYYRTRRMETARLLLHEGRLSAGEIAALLEYSSVYTFSRAFKETYGVSPAHYRRTAAEAE